MFTALSDLSQSERQSEVNSGQIGFFVDFIGHHSQPSLNNHPQTHSQSEFQRSSRLELFT
ncbi:hypothetical protein EMIT0P176_100172 [Pseudomonas sp. IT-P176]